MTYYAEMTNYPKIYNCTYWGRFKWGKHCESQKEEERMQEVIKNRNRFIDDCGIKKVLPYSKQTKKLTAYVEWLKTRNQIDHLEIYLDKHNDYVLINSPYGNSDDQVPDMQKFYTMYNDATTFVKILPKEELKNFKIPKKTHFIKKLT